MQTQTSCEPLTAILAVGSGDLLGGVLVILLVWLWCDNFRGEKRFLSGYIRVHIGLLQCLANLLEREDFFSQLLCKVLIFFRVHKLFVDYEPPNEKS